jgi:hypothetical protein
LVGGGRYHAGLSEIVPFTSRGSPDGLMQVHTQTVRNRISRFSSLLTSHGRSIPKDRASPPTNLILVRELDEHLGLGELIAQQQRGAYV